MSKHSLFCGGYCRPYPGLQAGPRKAKSFKKMEPNATEYASLAKTAVFDPESKLAGVASPVYDAAGNYLGPAMAGELKPDEAAKKIRDELQSLTK